MTRHSENPFITVVSGLPRSGTSMMMAMLDAGGMPIVTDARRTPDIHNPNGYFECAESARLRVNHRWLDGAVGRAVKVVSMHLFDLPPDFEYRIVFMERDLSEVVKSQRAMVSGTLEGADMAENELLELYRRHLEHVRNWLGEQPNLRVHYVNHRAVLRAPLAASLEIDDFLDNSLSPAAMAIAVQPALYRSR